MLRISLSVPQLQNVHDTTKHRHHKHKINAEHSIEEITAKQKQMRMYRIIPQTADLCVAGI